MAVWALSLGLAWGAGGFQSSSEDSARLFDQARRLFLEGAPGEAGEIFRRLVPILREQGDNAALASALNALSAIDSSQGRYQQAAANAREAASIRESLGDAAGRGDSLTNLGLAQSHLGDYPSALDSYRRALGLYQADGDVEGVTLLRNNIGSVLLYQGRYGDAFAEYQKALEACRSQPGADWSRHQLSRTTINLAALHQKMGSYDRALELYSSLDDAAVLSPLEEARRLANLGALYRHLGDAVKALDAYRRSLALHRTARDLDGEIGVLKNTGIAQALDLNDLKGALETFEDALALAENSGNQREEVQALLYRGEALRRLGRLDDATADLERALAGASELGAAEEEWKALHGLGRVAEQRGEIERARRNYEAAVSRIDSVRSRLQLPSLAPGFLADKRQAYDALIWRQIADAETAGTDSESFSATLQLIEKARSQAFRERLDAEPGGLRQDPDRAERQRRLRAEAAVLWQRQLNADPEGRREIQARLAEIENRYLALEGDRRGGPATDGPDIGLGRIQARLPEAALLLVYWVGEDRAAAFSITRSSFALRSFSFGPNEDAALRRCSRDLADPSAADWRSGCQSAAATLLGAIPTPLDGVQRLALVLDRPLDSIPFEALPHGEGVLLQRFEVEYLPGAAFLADPHRSRATWADRLPWAPVLLAFGAPGGVPTASADEFGEQWPELPHAQAETESAARILPGRAVVRLGAAARKEELLERLSTGGYPILHLATHAVADPVDPELSRILLSSADPDRSHAFLFLGEVLELDLRNTRLAVLSACETGRGRARLPGASRDFGEAFLRAGADAAAVTLWRVSDQASANFMEGFYSFISRGQTSATALRHAKLRFLQSGKRVEHPYYWAGFVLYGDGFSGLRLPFSWLAFGIAPAVLAALWVSIGLWRRKTSASRERPQTVDGVD